MKFSELKLNANVLDALDAMRFDECTPIQEQAIPIILEGKDLIAVAQTGTGKTAAFLLPILNKLSEGGHPEDAINCVIMSPTRELAQQIDQQMEGFSYFMPASSVAVYGGNDGILFEQQKKGLTLGADVVIATPGRLIAHLSLGYVDLSKVSYFILDEADRMLDMGFYEDIMQIVKYLPKERQTIMFSATMPAKIQQLAKTILNNPAEIKLAVSRPADKIIQAAYVCYENQKLGIIRSLFTDEVPERVIIFASSKIKVKEVTKALKMMKLNVGEMHSDLEQAQREVVMHEFKAGRINILVATDIVARGIDIDDIRLVINFDVPHDAAGGTRHQRRLRLVHARAERHFRRGPRGRGRGVVPAQRAARNARHHSPPARRLEDRLHRGRHAARNVRDGRMPAHRRALLQRRDAALLVHDRHGSLSFLRAARAAHHGRIAPFPSRKNRLADLGQAVFL